MQVVRMQDGCESLQGSLTLVGGPLWFQLVLTTAAFSSPEVAVQTQESRFLSFLFGDGSAWLRCCCDSGAIPCLRSVLPSPRQTMGETLWNQVWRAWECTGTTKQGIEVSFVWSSLSILLQPPNLTFSLIS